MRNLRNILTHAIWIPRAILELLYARIKLISVTPRDVVELNSRAQRDGVSSYRKTIQQSAALERVIFLVPRVAARVPWRSDCLVQALATQRWLYSYKIPTKVEIGVQRGDASEFRAHAWAVCDEQIILGGEISSFSPLLSRAMKCEATDDKVSKEK